ncbi:hypothetical protein PV08_07111 [Exophiala spinifera]|uniref:NB-ARC domain-containing protein n=1 Tax=Exophiala spinifera TaxID=91928 RepID=A0A0D2BSS0_9EURO|nr:uncharacterized protein PV08_07111 [Exophiala spinifera]KIW14329.1 hypothetical protein PV08_07111 [Exophiala spinifera]
MSSYTTYFSGDNWAAQVGTNLGTINFNQSAPKRSSTPPTPSLVIPYRRDPDFVDRNVLTDLWQKAFKPEARVALTWVFWVHASTVTRFEESFRTIATSLRLPGLHEPNADVLGTVHGWLSDERQGRWTMIVDNADDRDVLFTPRGGETQGGTAVRSEDRPLTEFLPISRHGSLVVTSRNQEVVSRLQVYHEDVLEVRPMAVDVATELFLKKLKKGDGGGKSSVEAVEQLVRHLDCMPLAISQAATYIDQCAPRMTVSRYINILTKSDSERNRLLQKDIRDSRRDRQASNSIIMTWHITFTHLRQTRDSAARLLALMCLFDREAIPVDLLQGCYTEEKPSEIDFEGDIAALREYDLIGIGADKNLFDMHRLVQLSTQKWLEMRGELVEWQERYIDMMGRVFPRGEYENWATCQALFPHVVVLQRHDVSSVPHRRVWAKVLYHGSWYAWQRGQYVQAETMVRSSLTIRQETLEPEDMEVLDSTEMLALVLRDRGKYTEAEEMNRRALAGNEKMLGSDHPYTLTSVNILASVLRYQEKYIEAEEMNRQALAGREKVLGVDHPYTLISVGNLASVLRDQERYTEAEEMNRRALAGFEKVLGSDYPDTLISVGNLALVLQYQGKYTEAEEMNRRALAGCEKVLGADHPYTLISVGNLASVLRYQEKYIKAEEMNRQALARCEKVLGADHPYTLISVGNLASVLRYQEKYIEAEEMNRQALARCEKVLGADHPHTLASIYCLADLLSATQRFRESLKLYDRAVDGFRQVLGPEHPITVACQRDQAALKERIALEVLRGNIQDIDG